MTFIPTSSLRTIALASTLALLAACSGPDADAPDAAAPAPPAAVTDAGPGHDLPWILHESQLSGTALTLSRGDCGADPFAVDVHWALQPSHGSQPQIWIVSGDQEPKLWVAPSQREGSKQTGAWLTASSALYLVDGTSNVVIARAVPAEVACAD